MLPCDLSAGRVRAKLREAAPEDNAVCDAVACFAPTDPPPIDCTAPWSPQGLIISDTTALILAECFEIVRASKQLSASCRRSASDLARAFDEVEIIGAHVARVEEGGGHGVD